MAIEAPRQIEMFTGELVDNRTGRQKQSDKEREQPQQAALFSSREIAQFGVKAKPLISISPWTRVALTGEDPRTDEERERELQRTAEGRTDQMFNDGGMLVNHTAGMTVEQKQGGGQGDI